MKVYVIVSGSWSVPEAECEIHKVVCSEDVAEVEVARLNNLADLDSKEYDKCEDYECRRRISSKGFWDNYYGYVETTLEGFAQNMQ